jgi:hypothetical protein
MLSATNANHDPPAQPTRRARRWRAPALFLALYVLLVAFTYTQFTCRRTVPRVPSLTGFDDLSYFVYARSLFFDGDLDFRNDYKFIVDLLGPDLAGPSFAEWLAAGGGGRPPNHFGIGTGLAAVPWLAFFHAVVRLAVALGLATSMPPSCGPWYMFAYLCANLFYGLAGLWLTARVVTRHFEPAVARAAVVSCAAAGPALYYFLYQPGMSHLTSLGLVAGALWLVERWSSEASSPRRRLLAFVWGVDVGFALCVRAANLPLVLLGGAALIPPRRIGWSRAVLRDRTVEALAAAAGGLIAFLPQIIAWRSIYGHWIANPQSYEAGVWPRHCVEVLFGRRHGLFFWHPWMLIGVVGLVMLGRHNARLALSSLAVLLGMAWVYGNWRVYWLGVSFGQRGFVEFLPLFALGAAAALERLLRLLKSWRAIAGLIALFTIINLHLMICFRGGVVTVDGPLFWRDTLTGGRDYFSQIAREWRTLTTWREGFAPGERASLWEQP